MEKQYMKVDFTKSSVMPSVKMFTEEEMTFDRVLGIKHRLDQACIDTKDLAIKVTPREYCLLSGHHSYVHGRIMGEVCGISIVVGDKK